MTKAQKAERAEAVARMHEWVKPGDTVYTILRHVSRSGMQREIGIVLLLPEERRQDVDTRHGGRTPVDLHPNYAVAEIIGARVGKHDGVIVGGCGMDMGFHVVYTLSRYLYPDGFGCIGAGCPSNDHGNGDRDYTAHGCTWDGSQSNMGDLHGPTHERGTISGGKYGPCHWHRDGGYALRQRWL
jgi:hypothetical protein